MNTCTHLTDRWKWLNQAWEFLNLFVLYLTFAFAVLSFSSHRELNLSWMIVYNWKRILRFTELSSTVNLKECNSAKESSMHSFMLLCVFSHQFSWTVKHGIYNMDSRFVTKVSWIAVCYYKKESTDLIPIGFTGNTYFVIQWSIKCIQACMVNGIMLYTTTVHQLKLVHCLYHYTKSLYKTTIMTRVQILFSS